MHSVLVVHAFNKFTYMIIHGTYEETAISVMYWSTCPGYKITIQQCCLKLISVILTWYMFVLIVVGK